MDIPKPNRVCSASQREFQPGDIFFSALLEEEDQIRRLDFSAEYWTGPPEPSLGWWKTKVPRNNDKKVSLAPNEILINLFEQLGLQPENADMRYVLALLLIRRRLLRYEREEENEKKEKVLVVYAIRENATYEIPIAMPNRERLREIQNQLSQLLYN